ncbi:Mitochondrial beta-keto-acyl synthase [Maudiozyma exigua]|uniref:beta-ketoacyl-[acyl-carrier-protein] synthase I n=1 Tax=Maudiozyma exigua TaxID=34358 RepID=A0A9P7B5M8_MAUEX|nr:Mitochondrial beta-keto-acyl synthase [Kazachstania exigua]
MSRRVVITGVGCLTPLGNSVKESWSNLLNSKQCFTSIQDLPNFTGTYEPYLNHLPKYLKVGKCKPFDYDSIENLFTKQDNRRLSISMKNSIVTTYMALQQAKLIKHNTNSNNSIEWIDSIDPHRVSTSIGTGLPAIDEIFQESISMSLKNKKPSPIFIPKILSNMIAGSVSIKFNAQGPSQTMSTACATGNNSIIDGFSNIKNGYSNVAIVGATEESLHPLTIAGFHRLKSLSTTSNSRPFDTQRDGFVISEGTGVVILEELEHARKRVAQNESNVKILAELVSCGMSSDAYHITSPMEHGEGAQRSIEMALSNGNIDSTEIDYINTHATSTPVGDQAEIFAISKVLESQSGTNTVYVSSNKGAMGHLLGASGLVESIFTIMTLMTGNIPHTLNLENELAFPISSGISNKIHLVKNKPIQDESIKYAIANSFGFGGVNTSLLFKKWED